MPNANQPFLALLRGVNVGGQNVISKSELARCFEELGFTGVRTYIQSGNVLFRAGETRVAELTRAVEQRLTERLGQPVRAVVFPRTRYRAAVRAAPAGWGRDDDRKHNALFTLRGTTPRRAVSELPFLKPDIESLAIGPGVVFWSISKAHQTRTTWMKLAATPVYRQVTVRNHRTVLRLLELFDDWATPGTGT